MRTKSVRTKEIRKRLSRVFTKFVAIAILLASTMLVTQTTRVVAVNDQWNIACSSSPSSEANYLFGVAAQANDAVVAVGSKSMSGQFRPLIELWEPTSPGGAPCFQEVSTPSVASGHSELYGVAGVPAGSTVQRTFWAVGYQGATTRTWDSQIGDWVISGGAQTLIERSTDGGQSWSIVASPNVEGASNILKAVSAASAEDVWAVGYHNDGTGARTLILHWDDSLTWNIVPSPHEEGATDDYFYSVSALDSTHARAVGFSLYSSPYIPSLNFPASWNGQEWAEDQYKPVLSDYYNYLFGVTAISDHQVHAVGAYYPDASTRVTQALNWINPSVGWLQDESTSPGDTFWGIAPVTSTYMWAVGSEGTPLNTLTARRVGDVDDGEWVYVSSPNGSTNDNELRGVAVVPGTSPCAGGNNWAVGYYLDNIGVAQTLAMLYHITPQCDLSP